MLVMTSLAPRASHRVTPKKGAATLHGFTPKKRRPSIAIAAPSSWQGSSVGSVPPRGLQAILGALASPMLYCRLACLSLSPEECPYGPHRSHDQTDAAGAREHRPRRHC